MTDRKHLKARVRARMTHTGERYAAARAHVVSGALTVAAAAASLPSRGTNPGSNALRLVLGDVGLGIDEPLALILGGGAGIGVFQFHYAKEGFASLFLAGRHAWDDDLEFVGGALRRLGLEPVVTETTSARTADRQLRDALDGGRPVVAWLDQAELDTRGLPPEYRGGAYHVAVVHGLDDTRGLARLDDLSDVPVEVPLETLARARARIGKFRNRLLRLPPDASPPTADALTAAIEAGLDAMVVGFDHPRTRNFSLAALDDWSARLRGSAKDAWPAVFPAGPRLWSGLASINQYIEHYGSGGGLHRPMVAAGLRDAAARLGDDRLAAVAARYDDLGARWSDLARSALPDAVPAFRRTRELQDHRARLYAERGPAASADTAATWAETEAIRVAMADAFPLDPAATRSVLDRLATLVDAIHDGEVAALEAFRATRRTEG
jgi:hypothetical protein